MKIRRTLSLHVALCLVLLALGSAAVHVQDDQAADRFLVRDVMIPMRDGVRLHAKVFTPKASREPLH